MYEIPVSRPMPSDDRPDLGPEEAQYEPTYQTIDGDQGTYESLSHPSAQATEQRPPRRKVGFRCALALSVLLSASVLGLVAFTVYHFTAKNGSASTTASDFCIPTPCQSGGTCRPRVNGYTCQCPPGFEGHHCETPSGINPWYDGECGLRKLTSQSVRAPFIFGGQLAQPHEFPWQVGLVIHVNPLPSPLICGGTILNEAWILTAGHCLDDTNVNVIRIEVMAGVHNIFNPDPDRLQSVNVTLDSFIVHENYIQRGNIVNNDVALLRLPTPLTFSDDVMPVCPPVIGHNYATETGITSGWGQMDSNRRPNTPFLMYTSGEVLSLDSCNERGSINITEGFICLDYEQMDVGVCVGDSGGPLVVQDAAGRYRIVGVTSFGACASEEPDYFSSVDYFFDWIYSKMFLWR